MKNCLIFLDTKCQLKLEKGTFDFDYELFIQGQPRFPYEKKIRLHEEEVFNKSYMLTITQNNSKLSYQCVMRQSTHEN